MSKKNEDLQYFRKYVSENYELFLEMIKTGFISDPRELEQLEMASPGIIEAAKRNKKPSEDKR
jgi:hypothetical protein